MITTATLIALLKSQAPAWAVLAAAVINLVAAERTRQYEVVRAMGTLACEIENRRLLNKDSSALQRQYEQLAKLVRR